MTLLALGYALGLVAVLLLADFGALQPVVDAFAAYPQADKLAHFFMYGVLALVVNAALASRSRRSLACAIITGSTIVLIASTVDEYSNFYVTARGWSLADLAANLAGIVCIGVLPWLCCAAHRLIRLRSMERFEC
jgi:VanZ family protein